MTQASVIEQNIIDGVFYWDNIASNWFRLVHRASMDVVGHYREQYSVYHNWLAVRHGWNYQANGKADQHGFNDAEQARAWIEQAAKEWSK